MECYFCDTKLNDDPRKDYVCICYKCLGQMNAEEDWKEQIIADLLERLKKERGE